MVEALVGSRWLQECIFQLIYMSGPGAFTRIRPWGRARRSRECVHVTRLAHGGANCNARAARRRERSRERIGANPPGLDISVALFARLQSSRDRPASTTGVV